MLSPSPAAYAYGDPSQAYHFDSSGYQVPYTTVVHTEPTLPQQAVAIPRPSQPRAPASPQMQYAPQNNVAYDIPQQIPARPRIDMTPARVTAEPQGDNFTTQMTQVLRETFGLEPKGRGACLSKTVSR